MNSDFQQSSRNPGYRPNPFHLLFILFIFFFFSHRPFLFVCSCWPSWLQTRAFLSANPFSSDSGDRKEERKWHVFLHGTGPNSTSLVSLLSFHSRNFQRQHSLCFVTQHLKWGEELSRNANEVLVLPCGNKKIMKVKERDLEMLSPFQELSSGKKWRNCLSMRLFAFLQKNSYLNLLDPSSTFLNKIEKVKFSFYCCKAEIRKAGNIIKPFWMDEGHVCSFKKCFSTMKKLRRLIDENWHYSAINIGT